MFGVGKPNLAEGWWGFGAIGVAGGRRIRVGVGQIYNN